MEPAPKRLKTLSKVDCKNLNVDDFARIGFFDIEQRWWDGLSEGVTFQDRTHAHYFDDEPRSVCQQYLDWLYESAGIQKNFNLIDLQVQGDQLLLFRAPPDEKLPPDIWHKISQYNPREGPDAFGIMTQQTAAEATNPLRVRQVSRGIGGDYAPIDDVCQEVVLDCNWFDGDGERRRDATGKRLTVEQLCANLAHRMEGLARECKALERVILVGSWIEVNVCLEVIRHENGKLLFAFLEKVHFLVFRDNTDELTPHKAHWFIDLLGEHPNLMLDLEHVETRPDIEYAMNPHRDRVYIRALRSTIEYAMNPHRDRVYIRALRSTSPTIGNFSAHIEVG